MKIIENFDVKGCLPFQASAFPTCASGIENIFDGEFPQRIAYHSKKMKQIFLIPLRTVWFFCIAANTGSKFAKMSRR